MAARGWNQRPKGSVMHHDRQSAFVPLLVIVLVAIQLLEGSFEYVVGAGSSESAKRGRGGELG